MTHTLIFSSADLKVNLFSIKGFSFDLEDKKFFRFINNLVARLRLVKMPIYSRLGLVDQGQGGALARINSLPYHRPSNFVYEKMAKQGLTAPALANRHGYIRSA